MAEKENITKLVSKYEEALESGKSIYLDADEFDELAEYYDSNDDIESARDAVNAGLAIHPESNSLILKKAKFAVYDTQYSEALQLLKGFTSYDFDLYLLKIECFLQLGLPAEAYVLTKEILENEDSGLDNALAELGFLYEDADYFDEAILYFNKSLEYKGDNIDVLSDLSYVYEIKGEHESAISTCNKLLDIDPYNYEAWLNLGKLHWFKEEFEKAIDAFDFALTINEGDENVLKLKAHCLSLSGRVDEAISIFKTLLANKTEDPSVYFLLAECYQSLEMYAESLAYLDQYELLEGSNEGLISIKVQVFSQMGDLDGALSLIHRELEDNPTSSYLNLALGEIYLKQELFDEAETCLLKIYDDNQDDFHLLDMLAVTSIKKENYSDAIEYTEQMLDIDINNMEVKQRLALLYFEVDDKEQFNDLLEQFTDKELLSLFKFIYTPTSDRNFDRDSLLFYLNEARECRTLFKNLKY